MAGPHLRVTSVTVAAAHPKALGAFYSRLLGWPVAAEDPPAPDAPPDGGWVQLRPPEGEIGPTLNIEYDRQYQRPVWPSRKGEQTASQHLDIHVEDLDVAVAWAVEQGAGLDEFQPQDAVRVMRDPDGHPFCLFT
ncbi:MAG TPA: VOC family protein [Candidatus Dormibacteraeota bacterium]|jgi:catechol 2,3-dioxygenase-like lactoylglutathione lyase family enzyme|nr:VOC family protein [Candidatus Dormibacteraeota bacterium]